MICRLNIQNDVNVKQIDSDLSTLTVTLSLLRLRIKGQSVQEWAGGLSSSTMIKSLVPGSSAYRPVLRATKPLLPQLGRMFLHLAPPFLLDEYIPRYHLISSVDAAKKRSAAYAHLRQCNLCPRLCNINRYEETGHCLIGAETVKVSTIAPHFGEEPCLQGHNGSGSVFFSGCNLRW